MHSLIIKFLFPEIVSIPGLLFYVVCEGKKGTFDNNTELGLREKMRAIVKMFYSLISARTELNAYLVRWETKFHPDLSSICPD